MRQKLFWQIINPSPTNLRHVQNIVTKIATPVFVKGLMKLSSLVNISYCNIILLIYNAIKYTVHESKRTIPEKRPLSLSLSFFRVRSSIRASRELITKFDCKQFFTDQYSKPSLFYCDFWIFHKITVINN